MESIHQFHTVHNKNENKNWKSKTAQMKQVSLADNIISTSYKSRA